MISFIESHSTCKNKLKKKTISEKSIAQTLDFYFIAENKCSVSKILILKLKILQGGGEKEVLLNDDFEYYLFPSYIRSKWSNEGQRVRNSSVIFDPSTKFKCEFLYDPEYEGFKSKNNFI